MKFNSLLTLSPLPVTGYIRQSQLVRDPKQPDKAVLLPFSSATLWRKVKTGEFPQPVKLSARVTAWKVEDVRVWMEQRNAA